MGVFSFVLRHHSKVLIAKNKKLHTKGSVSIVGAYFDGREGHKA